MGPGERILVAAIQMTMASAAGGKPAVAFDIAPVAGEAPAPIIPVIGLRLVASATRLHLRVGSDHEGEKIEQASVGEIWPAPILISLGHGQDLFTELVGSVAFADAINAKNCLVSCFQFKRVRDRGELRRSFLANP
jgi:hypothetical protein